jgi:hypothetical protein
VSRRVRHFPIPPAVDIRPTSAAPTIRSTSSPATGPACCTASRASSPNTSSTCYSAKINTLGDRAEDVFLVSGRRSPIRRRCSSSSGSCSPTADLAAADMSSTFAQSSAAAPGREQVLVEAELRSCPDAHRVEDAVQVVAFVLHHARMEILHSCVEALPCSSSPSS